MTRCCPGGFPGRSGAGETFVMGDMAGDRGENSRADSRCEADRRLYRGGGQHGVGHPRFSQPRRDLVPLRPRGIHHLPISRECRDAPEAMEASHRKRSHRQRAAQPGPPCRSRVGEARKTRLRHHAEYRQPPPEGGQFPRQGLRASRHHELRQVPGLLSAIFHGGSPRPPQAE